MFLLLGFPLWVLGIEAVLFITWIVCVQIEFYGWSTFLMILSLVSLRLVMKLNIIEYTQTNPSVIFWVLMIGAICGCGWSFVKWILFLYKFKDVREEKLEEFRASQERKREELEQAIAREKIANDMRVALGESPHTLDSYEKRQREETKRELEMSEYDFLKGKTYKNTRLHLSPSFKDYKGKLVAWFIFWIPSLIGTLLDDVVRRFVEFIVKRFRAAYQYLSDKIVGNFPKPIPVPVPEQKDENEKE